MRCVRLRVELREDYRAVGLEGEAPLLPPCDLREAQELLLEGEAVGTEDLQFFASNPAAPLAINRRADIGHLRELGQIVHTRVCADEG